MRVHFITPDAVPSLQTFRKMKAEVFRNMKARSASRVIPDEESLASLHDAELIGIDIGADGRTLSLRFKKDGEAFCTFLFENVWHLRITGVMLQNVVSRAFLTPSERFKPDFVRTQLDWLCTLDDGRPNHSMVETATAAIDAGTLRLFYADASIGAEIAVLSSDVAIESEPSQ
ncbi:MAG: hypothetical protein JSR47_18540 [Proteobacteria bacterium]|nr:hypothetical protein [Pseudomonadota bacterium]